jgi:hypothetical protein
MYMYHGVGVYSHRTAIHGSLHKCLVSMKVPGRGDPMRAWVGLLPFSLPNVPISMLLAEPWAPLSPTRATDRSVG